MKNWNYINGAEVGNEAKVTPVDSSPKTGSKPNPDNNQNPKKNPKKEMTDKNGRTFREILEEVKKTGNARYTSRADVISHLDTDLYDICKKVPAGSPSFAYVSELQKTGWDIGTISKYTKEIGKIIDKYAKVGNSTEKLFYGLSKDAEKEEEKSDEALDELKKTVNTSSFVESAKRHMGENKTKADAEYWQYVIDKLKKDDPEERSFVATAKRELEKTKANLAKVGNATPNYRYKGFLITNPEGEYVVFLQDGIHVAFRGTRSKAMAEDWCDWHDPKTGKVLNSKVGNSAYEDGAKKGKEDKRKGKLITAAGFEMHAPGYTNLSFKEKEEYRKGYFSTNDLTKDDVYKWGNSSSDDKFAYVMREFEEGKLKTPDGKVVTDPAQAKAIAYSESKKTENGLARARNAIKK